MTDATNPLYDAYVEALEIRGLVAGLDLLLGEAGLNDCRPVSAACVAITDVLFKKADALSSELARLEDEERRATQAGSSHE